MEGIPNINTNSKEKESKGLERKHYKLETGESIEVTSKEFKYSPGKSAESSDVAERKQNVIFLPGWKMSADSSAAVKLCEAFAEKSKGSVFSVTTRAEDMPGTEDPLYKEAVAISRFIKEKGLTNVILAGHSQGGDKSINLATILQDDPELHVDGLVLLDSVGLYEQTAKSLSKGFAKDSLVNTPGTMVKKVLSNPSAVIQSLKAGNSVVGGIFKEVVKSKTESLQRMKNEITVMAQQNSRLDQVRVPVILISGAEDVVSNPDKIIPPEEEEKIVSEWEKKDAQAGTQTYIDPREKFLQQNVFPKSPYIKMVVPEKLGHHGLPLFRSKSVASASLYLLKRFTRQERN